VGHRTLEAQGISRDPARYGSALDPEDLDRTMTYREQLRSTGALAYEQLHTYEGWRDQAVKLVSLDRQYVKDLARDHVWRYDRSPTRTLERQHSMERTLELAMRDKPLPRPRPHTQDHRRTLAPVRQQLRQLAAALEHADDAPQGATALRVRLFDREQEQEHEQGRSMGW
jgi:hypothetical protein